MPTNNSTLAPGQELDGYQLIRFLGRGGFGEVWLCRSEAMGGYHALKFISGNDADLLEKEYHSLGLYRNAASRLRTPHLVPIEHINRHTGGLYYIMPLADGVEAIDPTLPNWRPLSLAALIDAQSHASRWFTSREIIGLIRPILDALQNLSDAGLVHRDVKPENILFFNGSPCLGDISLLGEDAAEITRRGTPGYATPSWYRGGLPDMYGAAATLYSMLTGNPPDKMGRAAFLWPPQGEKSLSASERAEWKRLHAVIRRATEEKVAERFVDFRTMAAAVAEVSALPGPETNPAPLPPTKKKSANAWVITGMLLLVIGFGMKALLFPTSDDSTETNRPPEAPKPAPTVLPSAEPEPPIVSPADREVQSDTQQQAYEDAQAASISLLRVHLPYDSPSANHERFMATATAIQALVMSHDAFEPEMAVQKLDECLDAISGLRNIPNVLLARLLLLQAAGKLDAEQGALTNPIFTQPGTDELSDRVVLLSRLNATDKAEMFLGQVLAESSLSARKKSEALVKRAEVRARLGKFAEAHMDAEGALSAVSEDPALSTTVETKLLKLNSYYPGYAAYLKTHPGK